MELCDPSSQERTGQQRLGIDELLKEAAATGPERQRIEHERERPCRETVEAALRRPDIQQVMSELHRTPEDLVGFYNWTRAVGVDPRDGLAAVRNPEILHYYFSKKGDGPITDELFLRIVPWIRYGERPSELESGSGSR